MIDDTAQRPISRYGRARLHHLPHRVGAIVLAVLGITLAVAVVVIAYQRLGRSDVKGDLFGFRVVDDQTVSVTINVTRSDPSRPVVCIVRARSEDGSETGRRELLLGPSDTGTVQVTTTVKSSKPPVIGDIYGCGTDVPAYLRSP